MNKEIIYLKIEILINENLAKNNYIDEKTFTKVNDLLLKKLAKFKENK